MALSADRGASRDADSLASSRLARWKSRPARPPISLELRQLIQRMAMDNPLWGEERIATELLLKLGVRGLAAYRAQVHAHAGISAGRRFSKAVIACDFFVTVTATFRLLYVLVVIHHCPRRLVHWTNQSRSPGSRY